MTAVYRNQSVSLQTLSSVASKEFDERGFDDLKSLMDEKSKLIPGPKKRYRISMTCGYVKALCRVELKLRT